MLSKVSVYGVVLSLGLLAISQAHAQALAGQMVANMMAEAQCEAGKGPPAGRRPGIIRAIDAKANEYFAAVQMPGANLKKLYHHESGGGWFDAEGVHDLESSANAFKALTADPSAQPAVFERVALVLGSDGGSARSVWKATRPGSTEPLGYYVLDMAVGEWIGGWGIWRVKVGSEADIAALPTKYCNRYEMPPLW
jgi:hypothetical protein